MTLNLDLEKVSNLWNSVGLLVLRHLLTGLWFLKLSCVEIMIRVLDCWPGCPQARSLGCLFFCKLHAQELEPYQHLESLKFEIEFTEGSGRVYPKSLHVDPCMWSHMHDAWTSTMWVQSDRLWNFLKFWEKYAIFSGSFSSKCIHFLEQNPIPTPVDLRNLYYLLSVNLLVFPSFSEACPWASWIMWRSYLCYCHYRTL